MLLLTQEGMLKISSLNFPTTRRDMAILMAGSVMAAIGAAEWSRPPVPYKQAEKLYGMEMHHKHVDAMGRGTASDIHPEPAWQTVGEDNRMGLCICNPTAEHILLISKSIKSQARSRALSDQRLASTVNSNAPEFQHIK